MPAACTSLKISCVSDHKPSPNNKTRRSTLSTIVAAPLLLTGSNLFKSQPAEAITIDEVTPQISEAPTALSSREQAIIDAYERCNPGVVNVFDLSLVGRVPSGGPQNVEQAVGNGSGFIYNDDGYIVTNVHVLANILSSGKVKPGDKVANVLVLGTDGYQQTYGATLTGTDTSRDIAVLKINAPKNMLRPLTLGDSDSVRVGQPVLAIGNPFGFEHTLTTGIISALERGFASQTGSTIGGGIQHDASVNPGNSGGPLIDINGRVIGINTAIFTNTGTSVGISFAAPINAAKKVVQQLIENGRVTRPSLGIQPATDPVARALKVNDGVLVQTLDDGSAAGKAGILPTRRGLGGIVAGDVIVAVNKKAVRNVFDLAAILDELSVGDVASVDVVRGVDQGNVEKLNFQVTLQADNTA